MEQSYLGRGNVGNASLEGGNILCRRVSFELFLYVRTDDFNASPGRHGL